MRLAGKIKMGYYRTPDEVVDRIKSFLSFPEVPVTVLDPCCGEGLALQRLCQDTNSITYGIELPPGATREIFRPLQEESKS